jgi:GNAT superfamily N-acetyltransferase
MSSGAGLSRPVVLSATHDVTRFDCGKPSLNDFFRRFALENQKSGKSRTYVAARSGAVVAFYSLAPAGIAPLEAPPRIAQGQGAQDIPGILLARLAVDKTEQGAGLGSHMLLDALRRAVEGAEAIGGRAVLVHAKDEEARGFYERFGFDPAPTHDLHLLMLIKDLRMTFGM